MLLLVLFFSLIIGFLVGTTGIGGILLPPVMYGLLGMNTHVAMGTSLASFIVPTMLSAWLHYRHDNIDREAAFFMAIPGIVCVLAGTWLKARMAGSSLSGILAVLIIYAGILAFRPIKHVASERSKAMRQGLLAAIGTSVGIVSGLTGAGGPVLTVPLMIVMGYTPLCAIATGQIFALGVSCSGTVGNAFYDSVDFPLALLSSIAQTAGIWAGIVLAHAINTNLLKKLVAGLCVFTGVFLLLRIVLG